MLSGTIHGPQDPDLGASVGQTLVRQSESRGAKEGESEPKQCPELLHVSPELQDFLLECRRPQVRHVQARHDLRCLAEPPTGGRARDSEVRGNGHVPGPLDEMPKPVVIALLRAPRGRHEDDCQAVGSRRSTPRGQCGPSVDMRWSASVTRTRAGKCRMSVESIMSCAHPVA